MTFSWGTRGAVSLLALLAAGTAQADVTAAEVWADWKDQLAAYGDENVQIGAEETSSGTVTVRDLAVVIEDVEATITTTIETITFNEQSDGTVRVTMDDSFPIVVDDQAEGVVITVDVSQQGLEMIVGGDPDAISYAITADSYEIALRDVVDGDITFNGDAKATLNNVDLTYTNTIGEMRDITYAGTVDTIDFLIDFQIPGGGGEYITAGGQYGLMTMDAAMTLPLDADFEDPDNLINDGFAFSGGYTVDGAEFVMDINADGSQLAGSGTLGVTTLSAELNNATIGYDAKTEDLAVSFQTDQFPLPIDIGLAEYGVGFRMPAGVTDEPADFGLSLDFVDLTISDTIWNLFDAGQVLPRDPATVQIAIAGQARALYDIFDPEQQGALATADMPYELSTLNLDTLNISVAGAAVTGEGAFTFDNTDMQTFAPFPRPEGEATVQVNGLNALLDNLVAMGLVPEQDVMGPRMMMGMFARSTGDDQMETSIEVLPNGQVNVNGNRVR
ncbi:MAG: DUF2125 domain-containing protein [Pseudomonadota bacterium]